MNIKYKANWTLGIIVLTCLIILCAPAYMWAADTDGDGLDESLEREGIVLINGFDLWDPEAREWNMEDQIPIPGEDDGGLSTTRPDLFVIWREAEPTNIDLAFCDIFEFGSKSMDQGGLGFNIWVLREKPNFISVDRIFTDGSEARAVVLIESLSTATSITGFSEYGTISLPGKGRAAIYTQTIVNNIEEARLESSTHTVIEKYSRSTSCEPDAAPFEDDCLECLHFKNTAIHEILHVLVTLENNLADVYSHHLTSGDYIMTPAIVWKLKKNGESPIFYPGGYITDDTGELVLRKPITMAKMEAHETIFYQ